MTRFLRLFFLGLFALLSIAAQAQPFPSKPLKLVVPFAAGGTSDVIARVIADKLKDRLRQPVLVGLWLAAMACCST